MSVGWISAAIAPCWDCGDLRVVGDLVLFFFFFCPCCCCYNMLSATHEAQVKFVR